MIEKIKVIEGLYYIKIPQADLYIQCGAPAESVKHLIKNNHIKTITKDGVEFQTGPNAILLSDVMIQNGEFSNLSEFPILHILYKQCKMIPNHPNNNGEKPILIGSDIQIKSQLNYIYRGNYGLVSKDEMLQCGISEYLADQLMDIKLKFAFGDLKQSDQLIDPLTLNDKKIEIKNGVYIQRVSLNIFKIIYKDQVEIVDLNLKDDQTYPSPYTLKKKGIKREYFSIIHSGQGDGWNIEQPSANSIITFQNKLYLVDVVPNIMDILESFSLDINEIDGVFLTHCHDDHLSGVTSLIRSDKKVNVFGHPLVLKSVRLKLSALLCVDPIKFSNYVNLIPLKLDSWNDIDSLEVKPSISPHPVENTIFQFRTLYIDGYISYGHYMDMLSFEDLESFKLDDDLYKNILDTYKEPLTLKKVDIGGGMIHGKYDNFKDDRSKKVVYAHYEHNNTYDGVSYGDVDVLIEATRDLNYDLVRKYILINFPTLTESMINIFLNFEIVEFEPNFTICNEGDISNYNYLILNGKVKVVDNILNHNNILTPGVIIGEHITQMHHLSHFSITTQNYIKALKIPVSFFDNFLEKHNLSKDIKDKMLNISILYKTELFEDEITYSKLSKIVDTLKSHSYKKDQSINLDTKKVYIIISGKVDVYSKDKVVQTLRSSNHFGGITSVLKISNDFSFKSKSELLLYSVDADILRDIPIIRWKILEYYEKLS